MIIGYTTTAVCTAVYVSLKTTAAPNQHALLCSAPPTAVPIFDLVAQQQQ